MVEGPIYTTGGTVQAGGGIYLERQADQELLNLCRQGTFAYVLTPRQMGKSSLMVRTAERLSQEGTRSVIIDLTALGVGVTAEQWYLGLLTIIEEQLDLETNVVQWWQKRTHLGFTQRMTQFFKEVLLAEVAERVVIFVDEIDSTLSLDFTDDFFAAIRYLYVARAQEPDFHRLSFVLIGVATPSDLIRDPKRTPFNVGQRVDLADFTVAEAMPLAAGLRLPESQREAVMGWVLQWTGGHPYLSQRLCGALVERRSGSGNSHYTEADVDQVVNQTFFGVKSEQDNNLQFVRDMLTKRAPASVGTDAVLKTYREIRRGRPPVPNEEQSLVKSHLKLSGVVKRKDTRLIVSNSIYRRVFDADWVQAHLPETWWQRLKPAMPLLATMLVATVGMAGVTAYAVTQQREAKRQERLAQDNAQKFAAKSDEFKAKSIEAQKAQQEAENEKDRATREKKEADRQRQRAERGEQEAKTALTQAQAARTAETQQRRLAEQRQQLADSARQAETRQRLAAEADGLGISALRDFESGSGEIEALLKAIQAGQKLKALVGSSQIVEKYPTQSPVFALQKILDSIHEQNRFDSALSGVDIDSNRVNDVSFSSDGERIAIARRNGNVEIWDKHGREIAHWQTHKEGWLEYISFSPDGRHIATMGGDGWIRLWDIESKSKIAEFGGERVSFQKKDNIRGNLYFDFINLHNEKRQFKSVIVSHKVLKFALATVDVSGNVQLWNWSGELVETLKDHKGGVKSVIFDPTSQHIVTVENDDSAQLWDTAGKPLTKLGKVLDVEDGRFRAQEFVLHNISFSPNGKRIATISKDQVVRIWNLQGKKIAQIEGDFLSVLFTPDGKYLATQSSDRFLRLWNLSNLKPIDEFDPLMGIDRIIGRNGLGVPFYETFSPDSQRFALVGHLGRTAILDWSGSQLAWLKVFNQPFVSASTTFRYGVAFSPDWKYLVSGTSGNQFKLWNLSERQFTKWTAWKAGTPIGFFTPDRQYIATVTENNEIQLHNLSGQIVANWGKYKGHVLAVLFSPKYSNNQYIATIEGDSKVKVWDSSGKLIRELNTTLSTAAWDSVSFSLDGSQIAVVDADNTVSLWSVSTDSSNPLAKWSTGYPSGSDGFVYSQSHSPNSRYVATAGQYGKAQIFDTAKKQTIQLRGHEGIVTNITFSSDGQYVATAGSDGTARLWDLSGHELKRFLHQDLVQSVSFSPNSQFLATNNSENTVRIWALSGTQIAEFKGDASVEEKVTFSLDGNQIILIGSTVQAWKVEGLDALLVRGCNWLEDYLKNNQNVSENQKHICDKVQ